MPQLNIGRYEHACGSYLNDEGNNVRVILDIKYKY